MKVALITGAAGFVGSNLAALLLRQGFHVRAFHRAHSSTITLDGLDVEHRIGDVRDIESVRRALKGCDVVFHAAAVVSYWRGRYGEQMETNVGGTRNVVGACLEFGIEKLIHTSSIAALGHRDDGGLIDETILYNGRRKRGYRYSKYLAELEILIGVEQGLFACIVNPTVIVGPGDLHFHGGQIVRDVVRGWIPVYVDGGMNIVSVHDVARGHLAAAERGRTGERYIIGGQNLTFKETFDLAARVLNGRSPSLKVPVWAAKALAAGFDVIGTMMDREPWITLDLIANLGRNNWCSIEKAKRELSYAPSAVEAALQEAYAWYKERNLL